MQNIVIAFVGLYWAGAAFAEDLESLQISSGDNRIALVELYTSEGCSSCPPADRWMSKIKSGNGLWRDYVPVTFHVDYWNYIGWNDRFSDSDYTERQRSYVENGHARTVYTPGFFLNGEEWRGWFRNQRLNIDRRTVGNLSLGLEGRTVAVRFDPAGAIDEPLIVNVALLGMQLQSDVTAGENSGKLLKHDFVVLNWKSVELTPSAKGFKAVTKLDDVDTESADLALAAWVTKKNDPRPIQAVGGFLPNPPTTPKALPLTGAD